jgi:DNA-binding MarR family transcriptional regulator
MNPQKQRRRRGVILTAKGLKKLQIAKSEAESDENDDKRYTLENLNIRTGLDPDTLMKVFACEAGVDKRTLTICFRAFNLQLEPTDYQQPQRDQAINNQHLIQNRIDWGEAPDVSEFYGRMDELATLKHWILKERCRLITLLGMGGMGKTSLSIKLAEQIQDQYEFVVWRSLRNAPPVKELLAELIRFVSNAPETDLPETVCDRISRLISYLRASHCLLVFDNVETILQGCDSQDILCNHCAGCYCQGYEGYGELFKRVGEARHQSCLVLTSREQPKEIRLLQGEKLPIRVLQVKGLQLIESQDIFRSKGDFQGAMAEWHRLINCYAGNPLALKVVATTIYRLFDGSIAEFLKQNTAIFGEIYNLLDQQFNRLSVVEQEIIKWLVYNHQPVSFSELRNKLPLWVSPQALIDALASLESRTFIDKKAGLFSLQPLLREYVSNRVSGHKVTEMPIKISSSDNYKRLALNCS